MKLNCALILLCSLASYVFGGVLKDGKGQVNKIINPNFKAGCGNLHLFAFIMLKLL